MFDSDDDFGYAMALSKPLIIVSQDITTLPFDVKDMQALSHDRTQLHSSLGLPLRQVVQDTLSLAALSHDTPGLIQEEQTRLVTALGVQLSELKDLFGHVVNAWAEEQRLQVKPEKQFVGPEKLQGGWINNQSKSYVYVSSVDGLLVAPYCYGGNTHLTAFYYDWQNVGGYLFARFKWVENPEIRGFTFLKLVSRNILQGAWWYDDEIPEPVL